MSDLIRNTLVVSVRISSRYLTVDVTVTVDIDIDVDSI